MLGSCGKSLCENHHMKEIYSQEIPKNQMSNQAIPESAPHGGGSH